MDMVDRIMRAFIRQRPLTAEQEAMVRAEVTLFAQELLKDRKDVPAERHTMIDKGD